MKALIIENEHEIDNSILNFLEDFPNLFTEIQEELFCLNRSSKQILNYVISNDAIIVASTWMYIDQVETYLTAFRDLKLQKKVFIHRVLDPLNEWLTERKYEHLNCALLVIELMNLGCEFYNFEYDYTKEEIKNNNVEFYFKNINLKRRPYKYNQILYSKQKNIFYLKEKI